MRTRLIVGFWLVLAAALLAGCVTTTSGGFTEKKDDEQAKKYSQQLARSYISDRNWDAAKRHLKYALSIDENDAETHEALALVFQNTGELELAEKEFREAIRLNGKMSRIRNNYAAFLYEQRRYEEAADHLEIVAKDVLYERRESAFLNLGRCYVQLGKLEAAENAFRRAWLMDRNKPSNLLEMAEIHFVLGRHAEAQQYYDGYRERVSSQSARSLWLGIRLADRFQDHNALASYALALKSLYPRSSEYLAYLEFEKKRQVQSAR